MGIYGFLRYFRKCGSLKFCLCADNPVFFLHPKGLFRKHMDKVMFCGYSLIVVYIQFDRYPLNFNKCASSLRVLAVTYGTSTEPCRIQIEGLLVHTSVARCRACQWQAGRMLPNSPTRCNHLSPRWHAKMGQLLLDLCAASGQGRSWHLWDRGAECMGTFIPTENQESYPRLPRFYVPAPTV